MLKNQTFVDPQISIRLKCLQDQMKKLISAKVQLQNNARINPQTKEKLLEFNQEHRVQLRKTIEKCKLSLVQYFDRQVQVTSKQCIKEGKSAYKNYSQPNSTYDLFQDIQTRRQRQKNSDSIQQKSNSISTQSRSINPKSLLDCHRNQSSGNINQMSSFYYGSSSNTNQKKQIYDKKLSDSCQYPQRYYQESQRDLCNQPKGNLSFLVTQKGWKGYLKVNKQYGNLGKQHGMPILHRNRRQKIIEINQFSITQKSIKNMNIPGNQIVVPLLSDNTYHNHHQRQKQKLSSLVGSMPQNIQILAINHHNNDQSQQNENADHLHKNNMQIDQEFQEQQYEEIVELLRRKVQVLENKCRILQGKNKQLVVTVESQTNVIEQMEQVIEELQRVIQDKEDMRDFNAINSRRQKQYIKKIKQLQAHLEEYTQNSCSISSLPQTKIRILSHENPQLFSSATTHLPVSHIPNSKDLAASSILVNNNVSKSLWQQQQLLLITKQLSLLNQQLKKIRQENQQLKCQRKMLLKRVQIVV